eukprot:gene5260-5924_t
MATALKLKHERALSSSSDYRMLSEEVGKPRHVQWIKMSKKRKRKLIQRNLKALEKKAKKKSLHLGLDDYSHVESLVYSQLPFNPNGHHCSCNCLEEFERAPDIGINGLSFSKGIDALRREETSDNVGTVDGISGRDSEQGFSTCGSSNIIRGSGASMRVGEGKKSFATDSGVRSRQTCSKCKYASCGNNNRKLSQPNDGSRLISAKQDGSLRSKIFALKQKIREYTEEIDYRDRVSVQAVVNRKYSMAERQQLEALKLSDELRALKVKEMFYRKENKELKQRVGGKDGDARLGNDGGDETGGAIESANSRNDNDNDGLENELACESWLRSSNSSSFGRAVIQSVEEVNGCDVNGKGRTGKGLSTYSSQSDNGPNPRAPGMQLLPALIEEEEDTVHSVAEGRAWRNFGLSYEQKSASYDILWINRCDNDDDYEDYSDDDEDELTMTWPMLQKNEASFSFPLGELEGERPIAITKSVLYESDSDDLTPLQLLPDLIEEDVMHSIVEDVALRNVGLSSEQKSASYDILWINHSDNDDYEDFNDDDKDELSKTWPMLGKNQARFLSPLEEWKGERHRAVTDSAIVKADTENLTPVQRLVHRLDSGLTYGVSTSSADLIRESLVGVKEKIDSQVLAGSQLSEDEYYRPLHERQAKLGEAITKTIREEIARKGNLVLERQNVLATDAELDREDSWLQDEVKRRRDLVSDERNIELFVREAERREEAMKHEIKARSLVSPERSRKHEWEAESGEEETSDHGSIDRNLSHTHQEKTKEKKDDNEDGGGGEGKINAHKFANIAGKKHVVPDAKMYQLSTLKTVAQKHQTLRSLARLDEDLYTVSNGVEKLNKYRKKHVKAKIIKEAVEERDPIDETDAIALTRKEKIFSIPSPMNSKSLVESDMADNDKMISRLDFKYDMLRDLRFLLMNQSTSRANSYSYFRTAPPYLKTKWETRIKRGFLRGVKEQKINEKQLEKVEHVTHKHVDRNVIHSETLKRTKRQKVSVTSSQGYVSGQHGSDSIRRSSTALSRGSSRRRSSYKLPPLQLPGSRSPSPMDVASYSDVSLTSRTNNALPDNLSETFQRLSQRHKYQEKDGLLRNVVRLSAYETNDGDAGLNSDNWNKIMPSLTDRTMKNEDEAEKNFTPRLGFNRRHTTFVQNIATIGEPQAARNSNQETKRKISLNLQDATRKYSLMMQPMGETI